MERINTLLGIMTVTLGLAVNGHAQSFLTDGLVAYFPFNGNANDASGNGRNGQIAGNVTLAADRFGLPSPLLQRPLHVHVFKPGFLLQCRVQLRDHPDSRGANHSDRKLRHHSNSERQTAALDGWQLPPALDGYEFDRQFSGIQSWSHPGIGDWSHHYCTRIGVERTPDCHCVRWGRNQQLGDLRFVLFCRRCNTSSRGIHSISSGQPGHRGEIPRPANMAASVHSHRNERPQVVLPVECRQVIDPRTFTYPRQTYRAVRTP